MGIIKKIFNQVGKPEGFLGNMMVRGMNSGHARLSDWGLTHLPKGEPDEILEIGCGGEGMWTSCSKNILLPK